MVELQKLKAIKRSIIVVLRQIVNRNLEKYLAFQNQLLITPTLSLKFSTQTSVVDSWDPDVVIEPIV